jgi:hypothetical protein
MCGSQLVNNPFHDCTYLFTKVEIQQETAIAKKLTLYVPLDHLSLYDKSRERKRDR